MRRVYLLVLALLSLGLNGANCIDPNPRTGPRTPGLQGFSSPEELKEYLASQAKQVTIHPRSTSNPIFFWGGVAAPQATNAEDSASGGTGGSYSTTNVQEIGVDESDIVKNDGQTIYSLSRNRVYITKATPPGELAELARIDVEDNADSLYLNGDRLVVLSRRYGSFYWEDWGTGGDFGWAVPANASVVETAGVWGDRPRTTVAIYDVTDPANPVAVTTLRLEGDLVSSRMIESALHVITTTYPELPANLTAATIDAIPLEDWIPDLQVSNSSGTVVWSGDVATWSDFYRPIDPDGYQITSVVTLNVTDSDPAGGLKTTAISANAGTIYASPDSLYITDQQYSADGFTYHEDTMIHKLIFTGNGTDYVASGLVPGRLLSQYSLGEHEGYLRVASHVSTSTMTSFTESNSVFVLGEAEGELTIVGKIEGIAEGEQIYAARFLGDRGFLVTFRRIDPLFTLDLADPANPKVAGELKVPGYSDHIQLLDENHLLTVGKDAQDAGSFAWVQGVQLSVFDITDFANPQLLHKQVIGGRGTNSEANTNPKAFNYFAPLNALALPIDLYDGSTSGPEYGQHSFTGLYVYRVTVENGFELLGRIASADGMQSNGCYRGYYGSTRGVFIDGTVYSVTERGVKAAALPDASTLVGQTTFSDPPSLYDECSWQYGGTISLPEGTGLR